MKDFLDGKFDLIEETLIDGNIMDVSVSKDYYLCGSTGVALNITFTVKTVKSLQAGESVEIMDDGWNATVTTPDADRKTFTATISIPTGSTTDKRYFVTIKRNDRNTQAKEVVIKRAYNCYNFMSASEGLDDVTIIAELGTNADVKTIINSSENGATVIAQRTSVSGDAKYLYYLVKQDGYVGSGELSMTQYGFPAGVVMAETTKVNGEDYYVYRSSQKVTSHGTVQIQ